MKSLIIVSLLLGVQHSYARSLYPLYPKTITIPSSNTATTNNTSGVNGYVSSTQNKLDLGTCKLINGSTPSNVKRQDCNGIFVVTQSYQVPAVAKEGASTASSASVTTVATNTDTDRNNCFLNGNFNTPDQFKHVSYPEYCKAPWVYNDGSTPVAATAGGTSKAVTSAAAYNPSSGTLPVGNCFSPSATDPAHGTNTPANSQKECADGAIFQASAVVSAQPQFSAAVAPASSGSVSQSPGLGDANASPTRICTTTPTYSSTDSAPKQTLINSEEDEKQCTAGHGKARDARPGEVDSLAEKLAKSGSVSISHDSKGNVICTGSAADCADEMNGTSGLTREGKEAVEVASTNDAFLKTKAMDDAAVKTATDNLTDASGRLSSAQNEITNAKAVLSNKASTEEEKAAARETIDTNKGLAKNASKDVSNAEKATQKAQDKALKDNQGLAINERNETGKYGGLYGGANVSTTQALNSGVTQLNSAMQMVGQLKTNSASSNATNAIAQKGSAATQGDYSGAQAKAMLAAASAADTAALVGVLASGVQVGRAAQHGMSKSAVTMNAGKGASYTDSFRSYWLGKNGVGGACSTQGALANACRKEKSAIAAKEDSQRRINQAGEKTAQDQAVTAESLAAATTAFGALQNHLQANQNRAAANVANAESGFSFSPGTTGGYTPGGDNPDPTPPPGELVDSTNPDAGVQGDNSLNPNGDSGLAPNMAQGGLAPGAAPGGGGASGGGSLATGGTSPGKDDAGKPDNTKPTASAVGSYTGDGGGFVKNTKDPAPVVGLDNPFAKMLEGLLPKEKDEKEAANFDLDRMPASESAAVLTREKNIFKEVSHCYDKKKSEGAVTFNL